MHRGAVGARAESGFCQKIKLKSYPLIERGGILWAYMGPPELQPPFPEFEWAMLPASHCYNTKRLQECNYLQAMEGGIDSSHVSFLHSGDMHRDPLHRNTKGAHYQSDQKPKFEIVESAGGLFIAARRNAEEGHYYWRITQWIMPWYTMVPPYGHNALNAHAWVPIDDENMLHLDLHLSSDAAAVRHGARRDAQGRRHPRAADPRHVPARSSTRTTTT